MESSTDYELTIGLDPTVERYFREEHKPSITWGEVYDEQVLENHGITSLIRRASQDNSYDPEFDVSPDRVIADYEERGIPTAGKEGWLLEFADVGNEQEYQRKLMRHEERYEHEQNLAQLGGFKAIGAVLASYASDPLAVLADVATGGAVRGGKLIRMAKGAGQAMVANAAVDAILFADGESEDVSNIAVGYLTAGIIGGGAGLVLGKAGAELERVPQLARESIEAFDPKTLRQINVGPGDGGSAGNRGFPNLNDEVTTRTSAADEFRTTDSGTAYAGVRFDAAAQAARSESQGVRTLGELMLSNPMRRDRGAVVSTATETRADMLRGRPEADLRRGVEPVYQEWYNAQRGGSRVGTFVRSMYDPDGRKAFNKQIADYIRSEGRTPIDPEALRAVPHYQKHFDEMRKIANRADSGEGKKLESNPWYIPQVMRRRKVNEAFEGIHYEQRRAHLEELIGLGIRKAREASDSLIDDKLTKLVARAYAGRVLREGENGTQGLRTWDRDMLDIEDADTLREFLTKDGALSAEDAALADELLKEVTGNAKAQADNGLIDRMKTRLDMDMNVSVDLGDGRAVYLRDVFDDDIDSLSFDYGRSMAGEAAFRENGTSARKVREAISELNAEAHASDLLDGAERAATKADIKNLEYGYRATMGLPLDDSSDVARQASSLATGIGFIGKMGMAGLNAFGEAGTILAMVGLRRAFKNIPAMKAIAKELANKNTGPGLYREIQMLTGGVGDSLVRNMHGYRYAYDSTIDATGKLGKLQNAVEGTKRGAGYLNGLAYITDFTRKYLAVGSMSLLDDVLVHGKRAPSWFKGRMKSWGVSDARMQLMTDHLNNRVDRDAGGAMTSLRFDQMDDATRQAFEEFTYRFTAEGIQKVEAGNLPKLMSSPLGKVVMQFRSFTMAAVTRHTLKDLHMRDTLGPAKFAYTTAMFLLAGQARAWLKNPLNEEKRDEELAWDRQLRTATGYAVNASLLPAVADTVSGITLGKPVWDKRRTSGLPSGLNQNNISVSAPGLDIAGSAMTAAGIPATFLRGGELSRQQGAALFNLIGLDTAWWASGAKNYALDQLPSQSKKTYKPIDIYGDD